MKVNIEDPQEVLICVKGVPVCYVHIDGYITYLSQIVSILNTFFFLNVYSFFIIFPVLEINYERYMNI